MPDPAVIAATFSDWRPVKSRKVLQLIFEVPVEKTEEVLKALGAPLPHEDKWCAVTLLKEEPKSEKPKRRFDEMSRAQQAGILCGTSSFDKWLAERLPEYGEGSIDRVRSFCHVESRKELDLNNWSGKQWDFLVTEYRQATGQLAEDRS